MTRVLILLALMTGLFGPLSTVRAQSEFTIGPTMSASWYNPDEAGHGIMIHLINHEKAWMCWFTFDQAGNPAWICGQGFFVDDTILLDEAFTVEGGKFPPLFDPEEIVQVPWGTISITFTSCNIGSMEWTTQADGFESGSMPLVRLTPVWGGVCQAPPAGGNKSEPR